jgi:hypothetical protein
MYGKNIGQVCITYLRISIPAEHAVDSFCELRATGLVDTARIDPLQS